MGIKNNNKAKLFDIRRFPMDLGRLVCLPLIPIFRMKRLTPQGEKYRSIVKGGAVIAANHTSFLDPFLVGVTFWYRRMFFLVAELVMQGKLRCALLHGVGAIKIDRYAPDIEAIKKSVETLSQGHLLAVFPQGGISKSQDVETIKSGAVLMALRANVPIIPMHIVPNKHWYSRRKVIIGSTIYPKEHVKGKFPTTADINNITDILMNEMNRCTDHK